VQNAASETHLDPNSKFHQQPFYLKTQRNQASLGQRITRFGYFDGRTPRFDTVPLDIAALLALNADSGKRPVHSGGAAFEYAGYLLRGLGVFPAGPQFLGVFDLLRGEGGLSSEFHAAFLRGFYSGAGPFADQASLELGHGADHLPHGAACRRLRVDVLYQGAEGNAALFQVIEDRDQVAQAAAEPIQFPHRQAIATIKRFEATEQGRALGRRSGFSISGENLRATGFRQRGALHVGLLVVIAPMPKRDYWVNC
jgi:hypothetical protein